MARFVVTALVVMAIGAVCVRASDPSLTTDFFVPPNVNVANLDGDYFTFTGLEGGVSPAPGSGQLGVTKVFSNAFPALTGLGISAALLEYSSWGLNPPHTHPRGTELLYVISGTLNVGVIDTTNKLYEKNLTAGDLFVFPVGLVHYQINLDCCSTATAIASFSSSSPGLVIVSETVFGSSIPSDILAEAFSVGSSTISELEAPFTTPS